VGEAGKPALALGGAFMGEIAAVQEPAFPLPGAAQPGSAEPRTWQPTEAIYSIGPERPHRLPPLPG